MKKLLLLATAVIAGFSSQAQSGRFVEGITPINFDKAPLTEDAMAKGTANGDTVKGRANFSTTQLNNDSLASYYVGTSPFDSGYVLGANPYGDKGFAERFDITGPDSSVRVLGTFAIFDGRFTATSTKTISINVWSQGAKTGVTGRPKLFYNGFPNTTIATQSFSIRSLGINPSPTSNADTLKYFALATPTANISDSFFVGFTPNYTFAQGAGDTISLKSTRNGYRYQVFYTVSSNGDTIRNVKNATQYNDNSWHDNAYENFGLSHHLCVFPVFVIQYPTSVGNGISKNGLTFFGNYPNPAVNNTNIKFSLKEAADVTITITDVTGRHIRTIESPKMSAGTHVVPVNTSDLSAGNYVYLVRTSKGDGMGAQLTIVK